MLDQGLKVGMGTDVSGGFGMGVSTHSYCSRPSSSYLAQILSAIRDASVVSKILSLQAQSETSSERNGRAKQASTRERSRTPSAKDRNGSSHNHASPEAKLGQKSSFASSHLSLETLFYLATLGGAEVCCLEDQIGNFQVGKEFDALLIQTGQKKAEDVRPTLGPDNDFEDIVRSLPDPYPNGLNPALFVDAADDLPVIFEKCSCLL